MNIILESIRKVLLEGRIDDVKRKFPDVDPNVIDYFVQNDPSGNQKYLEWLVKAMTHEPTIQSVEEILDEGRAMMQFKTPQEFLMMLIKKFHELLPYLVHTLENGEKEGTTDLYEYKFTDSEMINFLGYDISQAKERKEEKDKEKSAQKNADKIYEDSNWLVIRAKTHESSCHYGAGTKWCTTMKNSSSHFTRETERNFLIYVINKKLTPTNPVYKVAWQIPYTKNVAKYVTSTPSNPEVWTLTTDKIKLWDAEDTNISSQGSSGYDYLDTVPQSVKGNILKYMDVKMKEMYENMAYVEDPKKQALIEHLGISEEQVDEIEGPGSGWNYGMDVFVFEDNGYAIATSDETDIAKTEWAESFIDDLGVWEALEGMYNKEKYIIINNIEGIANEEADYRIDDMTDEDIIDEVSYRKKNDRSLKELIEEYGILESIKSDFEEDTTELDEEFEKEEITSDEYRERLDKLEKDELEMGRDIEKLFNKIKEELREIYYREQYNEMTNNPEDWLRNLGYWDKDGLSKDAIKRGLVSIDEDGLANDIADDLDLSQFSRSGDYNTVSISGELYYIFPTDV
jgi:hypothetical protein